MHYVTHSCVFLNSSTVLWNLQWCWKRTVHYSLELGSNQDESVRSALFSDGTIFFVPPALSTVHCDRIVSVGDDEDDDHNDDDRSDDSHSDHQHGARNGRRRGFRRRHRHGSDSSRRRGADSRENDDDVHPEWKCKFKFGSWVYDGLTVSPQVFDNATTISLDDFIPDRKYEVMNTSATINNKYYPCCSEPYPDITFTMRIRRM